ncbi:TetR/AcrR family transcriptional regulator [Pseudovibrio sp. Tun.PSC04-5.I4]|uniref:TetR/AcrR family transcriptional regulator n=1 Tax=Pseudovibrio sp. Tun.PSC04-5.I4 TaxID=1798213 RepID=UPI0008811567|nr:TetR/AcrR family transcriptional regulator [Pseudovibrio sp. Tun.PSC04-5.I4]SDR31411.1 DNA-binding transcriptional regulator, AcrR family [Pseudovibrio sp. Tun.PSC04-5.I4]
MPRFIDRNLFATYHEAMTNQSFQRARSAEAKAQRHNDLIWAATCVLDEDGVDGLTLQAIASRAGIVKSNIYRYFESREAILVELLLQDFVEVIKELEKQVSGVMTPTDMANLLAEMFASRKRLCELMSLIAPTMEKNISIECVRNFKRALLSEAARAGAALQKGLPWLNAEEALNVFFTIHVVVAGLWPITNPPPVLETLYKEPEFAAHRYDFSQALFGMIAAHLVGLEALKKLSPQTS